MSTARPIRLSHLIRRRLHIRWLFSGEVGMTTKRRCFGRENAIPRQPDSAAAANTSQKNMPSLFILLQAMKSGNVELTASNFQGTFITTVRTSRASKLRILPFTAIVREPLASPVNCRC